MASLGFHIVLRLDDDRVIAPSRAERRRWSRALCAFARVFPIVSWKLADTHLHIVFRGGEASARELVRRLRILVARGPSPGVALEVQRFKPLAGQSHLEAAFAYALRQDSHHGLDTDVYQDSSAVLDVLGLRVLTPELPMRVRELLPRVTRANLLVHLGVGDLAEAACAEHLREAAMAAFALDALGLDDASVAARRAAAAALPDIGPSALAAVLGITPQAAGRLAAARAEPSHVRAVRLQMALRAGRGDRIAFVREPEASYV